MASFETHRRRVHDTGRSARARHAALRTCVVGFAPYGFHATYHHLCRSARIPVDLEDDPDALVRAVEELHAARRLWLADEAAYLARSRQAKALGVRDFAPDGGWRDQGRGSVGTLAFCPNPEFHPTEAVPVVVARVLRSRVAPASVPSTCRACETDAGTTRWRVGHGEYQLCARCGVSLGFHPSEAVDTVIAAARERRWKEIWRRAV
ncbi:hypothetical protein [Streptomyces sp. SID3343]|uniref:hypothetical protein n=1 Tax=Streptomyces sp. SID3343 TaxID=2690260 RepID=UPI00136D4E68|nr:hypothetical protein [Streptomyces sp. SID3343]MYW01547.1 hypothetical protein [Streptomyces sp. SID3343]